MINRKILYGYRIRNGILEIVPEEQQTVKRIFTLYNAGASYQGISDALIKEISHTVRKFLFGISIK